MTYYKSDLPDQRQHHYLFHIFRMDKDENPMPQNKVESLLQYLKNVLTDNTTKNRGRE